MLKRVAISVLLVLLICSMVFAFGESVSKKDSLVLEDFADATLGSNWWRFGELKESFAESENPEVGAKYLRLIGVAKDWYVGGRGVYLAKDVTNFNALEIWIINNSAEKPKVKIEIFDDDNNNSEIEQDDKFQPLKDDKYEYEILLNWGGWRKVVIPFDSFVDVNPEIGNNTWDPTTSDGSSGLTQMQFIVVAGSEQGKVDVGIGKISLVNK